MNKEKKGQITLFVIIGIVLLVIVFFTLSIIMANFESQLSESENLLAEYVDIEQLNFYFQSCIDETLDSYLQNMSKQGGVLYVDQGGLANTVDTHMYDGFRVYTGLEFVNTCPIVNSTAPLYPRDQTRLSELPGIYNDNKHYRDNDFECWGTFRYNSGFFGFHTLPRLCLDGGINTGVGNQFSQVTPCVNNTNIVARQTIEQNLNSIIENHSFDCIDDQPFQDLEGTSIEPILDEASTSVIFAPDRFLLNIEVPFEISNEDDNIRVDYVFDYSPGTNFVNLYLYVFELVKASTTYPYFNINKSSDYESVSGYDGYEVSKKSLSDDNYYILEVEDTIEDLVFRTVIEARPPALDYINQDEVEAVNLVFLENESLLFEPQGFDPDGNSYEFLYTGWLQGYESKYDFSDMSIIPISNLGLARSKIEKRALEPTTTPLMDSDLYSNTGKDANTSLNRRFTGLHHTQVIIRNVDDNSKFDYQNVSIAVVDLPLADFTIENYVNSDNYSPEVPIVINASLSSTSVMAGLGLHNYSIKLQDKFQVDSDTVTFTLINDSTDILFYDTVFGKYIEEDNDYELTVQGTSNLTPNQNLTSESRNLEFPHEDSIVECIPINNPGANPYPYNTSDAFKANTPCCVDYKIQDESRECYISSVVTDLSDDDARDAVTKESLLQPYFDIHGNPSYPGISEGLNEYEIIRYCDGKRGNICVGDIYFSKVS